MRPQLFDRLFGLPKVAALVGSDNHKARPDAVADTRVDRGGHLDLVNGPSAAAVQCADNPLLALKKTFERSCDLFAVGGLKRNRRLRSNAWPRLQYPREQAAPEIGPIRGIQLRFPRTGIGDDL